MKDQDIGQAWRAGNRPESGTGPSLDEIEDFLADRLEPARRQRLLDAIAEHGEYAWLLQMASEVQLAASASAEAVERAAMPNLAAASNDGGPPGMAAAPVHLRPPASRRSGPPQWVYAFAAALVLSLGTLVVMRPPAAEQTLRGVTGEQIEPADSSRLAQAPSELRWVAVEAVDGATRQVVVIYNERAEELWRSEPTAATEISLPSALRQELPPGAYYWQLEAEGGEGASRGPFRFEIAR